MVHDPYRALEDVKNPSTRAWFQAQGRYAAEQLAAIPGRDQLQARITELADASGDQLRSIVRLPGDRLFYLKRRAGTAQFNLVTREGLRGAERVLVDAEALTQTTGVPHAVNWFVPSWDGRRMAYGVSAGGSEDASMHVIDVASGQALIDPVPRVPDGSLVGWTPDSRGLAYNQLKPEVPGEPETEHYLDSTVFLLEPVQRERHRAAAVRPQGQPGTEAGPARRGSNT